MKTNMTEQWGIYGWLSDQLLMDRLAAGRGSDMHCVDNNTKWYSFTGECRRNAKETIYYVFVSRSGRKSDLWKKLVKTCSRTVCWYLCIMEGLDTLPSMMNHTIELEYIVKYLLYICILLIFKYLKIIITAKYRKSLIIRDLFVAV